MQVAISPDGRLFQVHRVGTGQFTTIEVRGDGRLMRHASLDLPLRKTRKEANKDMQLWGKARGCEILEVPV